MRNASDNGSLKISTISVQNANTSLTSTMLKLCMRRKKKKLLWIECATLSRRKITGTKKVIEGNVLLRICYRETRIDMISLHQEGESLIETGKNKKEKRDNLIDKGKTITIDRSFTPEGHSMSGNSRKAQEDDRKNLKGTTITFRMHLNTTETPDRECK